MTFPTPCGLQPSVDTCPGAECHDEDHLGVEVYAEHDAQGADALPVEAFARMKEGRDVGSGQGIAGKFFDRDADAFSVLRAERF